MIGRLLLPLLGLTIIAGCTGEPARETDPAELPAIWEISGPQGQTEGWLFGTIHARPDGIEWRLGSSTCPSRPVYASAI